MSTRPQIESDTVTAGAILTAARVARRLSVADVARLLKIAPQQVEALEADAYGELPGRVFARGFLRNYAKLLDIDPQPLLRSMERDVPGPELIALHGPSETVMPRGQRAGWPLYTALATFALVAALAVYEFGFNDAAQRGAPGLEVAPDPAGDPASSAQQADSVPQQQPEQAIEPVAPSSPPPQETALARNAGAISGAAAERQLHLRFDQDSWVEIRDGNNKVIFSKVSRAGRQEQVSGTPPFKVTVGNARGVHLKYEDQPVDLAPHTGVTVARVTLK